MSRYRAAAIAVLSAVLVYIVATRTEIVVIRLLQPSEAELTWISDAVLALAFGSAMFLWLRLKWTRLTLSRLEREHIVLDAQLSLAAQIQRSLLPPVPADVDGLSWGARLVSAGRIGGDLYDFVQLAPHCWLVLVGDVSGKGIPAALVHASIRTMFRMMTVSTSDPGELVERMSSRLYADYGGKPYLTCILLRIDLERYELAYANAGHPSGLVLDQSDARRPPLLMASGAPPAGLFPDQQYRTTVLEMPVRSLTILVTDGITEAFDMIGGSVRDPIQALIVNGSRPQTPIGVCDAIIDRTSPALASGEWQDDRTVVAFALDAAPMRIERPQEQPSMSPPPP